MLIAAAFVPSAPLLHPDVAAGAAVETESMRAATHRAVSELVKAVDLVVTVGGARETGWLPTGARGTFAGLGLDLVVGRGDGPVVLPQSLTLAAWLLDVAGHTGPVHSFGVALGEAPGRCAILGEGIAERAARVGLLVVGDGSARREAKAPGAFDERAEAFDEAAFAALTAVDIEAIAAFDPALCVELMVAGRSAWQVAAGAAAGRPVAPDVSLRGVRHHKSAPYGVGYAVIGWNERG